MKSSLLMRGGEKPTSKRARYRVMHADGCVCEYVAEYVSSAMAETPNTSK